MILDDRDVWPVDVPVGTFDIHEASLEGYPGTSASIMFVCPNGKRCGVPLGPEFVNGKRPVWKWDGNRAAPTITPSINCIAEKDGKPTGGCGWHGFITNGDMK